MVTQSVYCFGTSTSTFSSSKGKISLKADTLFSFVFSLLVLLRAESCLAETSSDLAGAGLYYPLIDGCLHIRLMNYIASSRSVESDFFIGSEATCDAFLTNLGSFSSFSGSG